MSLKGMMPQRWLLFFILLISFFVRIFLIRQFYAVAYMVVVLMLTRVLKFLTPKGYDEDDEMYENDDVLPRK